MLLIAYLKDESKRDAAIEALVKIGASAVELLIAVLRDDNWYVRDAAAKTLEMIGIPAVERFIHATKDTNRNLRRETAEVLFKIESDKGMAYVLIALVDDDYNVRFDAKYTMNGARASIETLPTRMPRMEATVPANDTATRIRLHCGLGT